MKSLWRANTSFPIVLSTLLLGSFAAADPSSFEGASDGAISIAHPDALSTLLWPVTAACTGSEDDHQRRRCTAVRQARARWASGARFHLRIRGGVTLGSYEGTAREGQLEVSRCLACGEGVEWDGARWRIAVGGGASKGLDTAQLLAAPFATIPQKIWSSEDAELFRTDVAPGVVTEWVVSVPSNPLRYRQGKARGVLVEAVAYRVYEPCSGRILFSQPASTVSRLPAEPCRKGHTPIDELEDRTPPLPALLEDVDVARAMRSMLKVARQCHEIYEVTGRAKPRMKVSGDGKVVDVEWLGSFAGTPTAACLEKRLRSLEFPKTQRSITLIEYPIPVTR